MKRGQTPHGYTVVEAMIFLTVSAVLLVSALALFNGQQNRTRFNQGLREMDGTINGVIAEVASGYYPGNGTLRCGLVFGIVPIVAENGGNGQGTNENCVMLGKSLQFRDTEYTVHTIVGRRIESNGNQVQTLEDPDGGGPNWGAQASVANGSAPGMADLSDRRTISGTLHAYDMYQVRNNVSTNIGSVAFIFTLTAYQSGNSDPVSGSTSVDMVGVDGTTLTSSQPDLWNRTREMQDADRGTDQVVVCFSEGEGGAGRKGAIVIGGQNNQLTTEVINDAASGTEPGRQCT